MAKSIFEEMGDTYHEENGYLIPDLTLPTKKEKPIGIWRQRHLRYIKEHKRLFYVNLLTIGKLSGMGIHMPLLFPIYAVNFFTNLWYNRFSNIGIQPQGLI